MERHEYPHEPPHIYSESGTYMITAATHNKANLFNTPEKLTLLQEVLLKLAVEYQWNIKGWAILNNHYHMVADSAKPDTLPVFINRLHSVSALLLNRLDCVTKRKVWHQYWDTRITFRNSYFARLNYVNKNPVNHGLVQIAKDYQWCSAKWFENNTDEQFQKMVSNFKFERLEIPEF